MQFIQMQATPTTKPYWRAYSEGKKYTIKHISNCQNTSCSNYYQLTIKERNVETDSGYQFNSLNSAIVHANTLQGE